MRVRIEGLLVGLEATVTEYLARFGSTKHHPAVVAVISEREYHALHPLAGQSVRLTWYTGQDMIIDILPQEPPDFAMGAITFCSGCNREPCVCGSGGAR
jgi:hypothetical protein